MKNKFPLSQKYIDFINTTKNVDADFLEGTTASGKTTVGAGVKFMKMVSMSKKKLHIIASKTTGTAEKNIIQQDNGILDIHHNAKYYGNGDKDYKIPHIKFEDKIIFVLGYDNKDKWSLVLGSQFGSVYIDEINTANIDFVREISTRNDYMLATLNPDDPSLPIYKEFINRSRPYKKYAEDVPAEIMEELKEDPVPKWRYWFFTFYDNLSLTEEDIEKKKLSAPKGTKLYKNKILGLRGRATGLIFSIFNRKKHLVSKEQAKKLIKDRNNKEQTEWFEIFTSGLDTSYSSNSEDTIAMSFGGITNKGSYYLLDERTYNNKKLDIPIAPSDTARNYYEFLERNRKEWGFAKDVFIDSADSATITELNKFKREHGAIYNFIPAWKKTVIVDRIILQNGWMNWNEEKNIEPCYFILNHCKSYIQELESYSWLEDKDNTPEDKNDHMVNSVQYSWLPYKTKIKRCEECLKK